MGEFAIGQSVLRREDPRLLRGHGRFFDDLKPGIVATAPWNVFYLTGFNGIAHKSDEPRPYAVIVRSSFERRGLER